MGVDEKNWEVKDGKSAHEVQNASDGFEHVTAMMRKQKTGKETNT